MSGKQYLQAVTLCCPGAVLFTTLGCVITGSLASGTGPGGPQQPWSTAPRQMVHVGEKVDFDFVLQDWQHRLVSPMGLADYCVAIIGNERLESDYGIDGHFRFQHEFSDVEPGREIKVEATAYRQRGGRDFMKIRDEWMANESPYTETDRPVAGDSLVLTAYRAEIDLRLAPPPDEFDLDSAVLRFRRYDGATTSVFIDRPNRPGFTMTGPAGDGLYHVRYAPRGDELNSRGTTDVQYSIYDVGGQKYEVPATLETP